MSETRSRPAGDIVRSVVAPLGAELRASTNGNGRTLFGHFAVFDQWTEINSRYEGRFMERIDPKAFDNVLARSRNIKVLYDHGADPTLGNKPLGPLVDIGTDRQGAYYTVDLIDTDYNNGFVIPAARAGLLGASFRFSVADDKWVDMPARSTMNPEGLPERTITEVGELLELGPVTFPAYEAATASVRSRTDEFVDRLASDETFVNRFLDRAGPKVRAKIIDQWTRNLLDHPLEDDAEERSAVGVHHTATAGGSWNGPATETRVRSGEPEAYYRRIYAWNDPEADPATKAAWKFIHHDVAPDGTPGPANLTACSSGIAVLNGGMGAGPSAAWWDDRPGIWAHLAAHLRDGNQEPPALNRGAPTAHPDPAGLPTADSTRNTPVPADGGEETPPETDDRLDDLRRRGILA